MNKLKSVYSVDAPRHRRIFAVFNETINFLNT